MKKKFIFAICTTALLLTGCRANSAMLIEYSDLNILKSSDILDMSAAKTAEAISKDIAVLPVSGNYDAEASAGGSSDETSDTDESQTPSDTDQTSSTAAPSDTTDSTDSSLTAGQDSPPDETDAPVPDPNVLSDTPALLINRTTNEPVYAHDAFKEVAPASLTKLMTALLVLEYGNLSDEITLTADMNYNMSPAAQVCGFKAGDKVTVEQLLYCMLIYSGNETANALGIYLAGNMTDFCTMMNNEAKKIGAVNTHFSNANGLDTANHYSSAYDLYLMFNACMQYDTFVKAVCQPSYTVTYESESGSTITSAFTTTNYYLRGAALSPDGITVYGGKTGTTDNAGACLILYAKDTAGNEYISVSLGNTNKDELYSQMNKILKKVQK